VIFLDTYMDRVSGAPDVGLRTSQVDRADYVLIGHSHFGHLWGADTIAHNKGATVIGSHETARLMANQEVPEGQFAAVSDGERIRLPDKIVVRVFPSQHSSIWAKNGKPDEVCLGELGLTVQERHENRLLGRDEMECTGRRECSSASSAGQTNLGQPR
jgi:L-ascorbate metabolism protein UlaG (beta-lactamase superfamily)